MDDTGSGRRGFWSRLRSFVRPPRPQPAPLRPIFIEDDPIEVDTPSLDDAFDFGVSVRVEWTTTGGTEEDLAARVKLFRPQVERLVRREIRTAVRETPPNGSARAEGLLNNKLVCLAQNNTFDDGGITWTARAQVRLADEVRRGMQEFWMARMRRDAAHELDAIRVDYLREMVKLWKSMLADDLGIDPAPYLAAHLVRLAAKPEETVPAMYALTDDRVALNAGMLAVVQNAISKHQEVGLFEFVTSYDSALKQLMTWVGELKPPVPLGDSDDGTPGVGLAGADAQAGDDQSGGGTGVAA